MTAFDVVAILIVLVSALVGFARGAVREIVTLVAFSAAAVVALLALPFTAPAMRHLFHPGWVAAVAAVLVVFILVYVLLRVFGGQLARALHASKLGGADRTLGAGVGLVRALVVLGGFFLVYDRAMPHDLSPTWITHAASWPVARASGHALATLAPSGGRLSSGVGRLMGENVKAGFTAAPGSSPDPGRDAEDDGGVQLGGSAAADAGGALQGDPSTRSSSERDSRETAHGLHVRLSDDRRTPNHHVRRTDGEESSR